MTIHVKLKGNKIIINPLSYDMKHGRNQVTWKMIDDSDKFDFADPPVTFDDAEAPMSDRSRDGGTATCTDNNENPTRSDIYYSYHVHLIGPNGPMTYPPMHSQAGHGVADVEYPKSGGDPAIRNKPK